MVQNEELPVGRYLKLLLCGMFLESITHHESNLTLQTFEIEIPRLILQLQLPLHEAVMI